MFDAALSYSRSFATADFVVTGVSTKELCCAAGMADSTYRRARKALLAGDVALEAGGGRANTNTWAATVR